ncbi:hypothetical protein TRIUR3_28192 [Triticum urartu]|uniref:Uncharacterized protein n=1 Tax=Triticum urartu TaxID=4572 RepID=M7YV18_TRIUA|nr:hypothetical protein TRIUR3_28192 [Triticum urartu]
MSATTPHASSIPQVRDASSVSFSDATAPSPQPRLPHLLWGDVGKYAPGVVRPQFCNASHAVA